MKSMIDEMIDEVKNMGYKKWNSVVTAAIFLSIAITCFRCAQKNSPQIPQTQNIEEIEKEISPKDTQEGSLFYEDSPFVNLYADTKAKRTGDIIIVRIVENIVAKNDQRKETARTSNIKYGVGAQLSKTKGLEGLNLGADAEGKNEFSSKGSQKSQNQFIAEVGARIIKVLPSGNFIIEGEKYIKHNDEIQKIYVRGIARPQDIMHDNSILSTSLADARIEYISEGDFGRKMKQGWLQRILDFISPF